MAYSSSYQQETLTTRFAPSPTGYLHLGHVASAIFVWGLGRKLRARVLLRIEDHDSGRCRQQFEQAIFQDLRWLGLTADNQEEVERCPSDFRQSDARPVYSDAIQRLSQATEVYACDCSRRDIATSTHAGRTELRYTGRCRSRGLAISDSNALRATLPDTCVAFADLIVGQQVQNPAQQCGDLLLRDRHANFTYQFAVVVDDLRQGVNLIIRGQDLLASTGRQIALARLLGRDQIPCFAHHPLLTDDTGKKLSKRFLSEAIAKRRSAGERPENILGEAAFLVGLQSERQPLQVQDLPYLPFIQSKEPIHDICQQP